MFPPLTEVFARSIFFFLGSIVFWGTALLMWKANVRLQLSKVSARRWAFMFLGAGIVSVLAGCAMIVNAFYLRVDPKSIAELEFTRIDKEQGAAVGEPRTINDPGQIQQAFALLSTARKHFRNHESYRDGYLIRVRLRGESKFSGRLLFAYRSSSSDVRASIVVPSVSRTTRGALVDAGEYYVPEFHDWLRRTVDPIFSGPPEAKNPQ